MAYNDWAERISAYIDEELDAADRGAVEAHLAACPECAKAAEGMRRVSGLVRALPRVAAPAGMADSVRAAVAPAQRGNVVGFIGRNRSWISSAAALVATMLIVYGFYSPSRNQYRETASGEAPAAAPSKEFKDSAAYAPAPSRDKGVTLEKVAPPPVAEGNPPAADPSDQRASMKAPASPQPGTAEEERQAEAFAAQKSQQEGASLAGATAPSEAAPPAAPGAPGGAGKMPEAAKSRERAADGLAQDFLESGQELTMLCGDAKDAERKVTRLLRDLRVSYTLSENHTTHVVAQVPADRAEEVLLALEMLEPRQFGWRVPASADGEVSKKDGGRDRVDAQDASKGGLAAGDDEEAGRAAGRRGRLAEDLLARALDEQPESRKEKSLADHDDKREQGASMTLVISLEARPEAERGK